MNFVQFEEALGLDGGNTRSSKLRLGCTENLGRKGAGTYDGFVWPRTLKAAGG